MLAYCTYCSAEKISSEKPLPAIELYKSERIAQVYNSAEKAGVKFAILSGKFGLVEPHQKIEYYDHLLQASEVENHAKLVAAQLREMKISELVFFTRPIEEDENIGPYVDCVRMASEQIGISLKFSRYLFME
jgi:hypothetical protein